MLKNPNASPEPEVVQKYLTDVLEPLATRYGARLIDVDTEAHRRAADGEVFYPATLVIDEFKVSLSGTQISDLKSIEFFLKHVRDVRGVVSTFKRVVAPFHSDIRRAFVGAWGKNKHDFIAYEAVCSKIRESGKTLTTD